MKNLSEMAGETLFIYQPSIWKSYYELKLGDKVLGTIRHPKFFSTKIIFKMENRQWEIYRPHFWKSEVAIRQAGYELPYATYIKERFKPRGVVKLYKGDQMLISYKLLGRGYNIQTLSGEYLVTFKDRTSLKDKTEIHIEQKSELLEKYPWVIILAWYLSVQRKRKAHAS
jgi:hypothetical protein